mmetsp:Transcript_71685/g.201069  ORF Transcript_71685/g.201069 Transcript_71685/m.201069 type:complete len:481 (-) Transcript_71685:420-1862(-)
MPQEGIQHFVREPLHLNVVLQRQLGVLLGTTPPSVERRGPQRRRPAVRIPSAAANARGVVHPADVLLVGVSSAVLLDDLLPLNSLEAAADLLARLAEHPLPPTPPTLNGADVEGDLLEAVVDLPRGAPRLQGREANPGPRPAIPDLPPHADHIGDDLEGMEEGGLPLHLGVKGELRPTLNDDVVLLRPGLVLQDFLELPRRVRQGDHLQPLSRKRLGGSRLRRRRHAEPVHPHGLALLHLSVQLPRISVRHGLLQLPAPLVHLLRPHLAVGLLRIEALASLLGRPRSQCVGLRVALDDRRIPWRLRRKVLLHRPARQRRRRVRVEVSRHLVSLEPLRAPLPLVVGDRHLAVLTLPIAAGALRNLLAGLGGVEGVHPALQARHLLIYVAQRCGKALLVEPASSQDEAAILRARDPKHQRPPARVRVRPVLGERGQRPLRPLVLLRCRHRQRSRKTPTGLVEASAGGRLPQRDHGGHRAAGR